MGRRLGALYLGKTESGLDLLSRYVALGSQLGDMERQKHDALAAAEAQKPTGTLARAINGWIRIVGTVPEAFDSRAHGLVGLHVMYLRL